LTKNQDIHTRCIHGGESPDPTTKSIPTPIYQSAVYAFDSMKDVIAYQKGREDGAEGYMYTRPVAPTQRVLEKKIASLEESEDALALSSGMAAITTAILTLVSQGDEIVSTDMVYGGTYTFLRHELQSLGIKTTFVDTRDIGKAEQIISEKTKVLYVETPSNPDLRLTDLKQAIETAKKHDIRLIVDNTFATPINQVPMRMGADIVVISTTKYYGGHNDLMGGAIVGDTDFIAQARKTLKCYGATADPFAAYLTLRGIKTLAIRMERHNSNAMELAKFLEAHENVKRVYYPGLESHPQHDLAKRQMQGYGGMICFEVESEKAAITTIENLKLIIHGLSLGGVESLISMPVYSSHYYLSPDELTKIGLNNRMIRLSVGLEGVGDLITDLEEALAKA